MKESVFYRLISQVYDPPSDWRGVSEPSETSILSSRKLSRPSETSNLLSGELSEPSETSNLSSGKVSEPSATSNLSSGVVSRPSATSNLLSGELSRPSETPNLLSGELSEPSASPLQPKRNTNQSYLYRFSSCNKEEKFAGFHLFRIIRVHFYFWLLFYARPQHYSKNCRWY